MECTDKNPFKGFLTPDMHIYSFWPEDMKHLAFAPVPSENPVTHYRSYSRSKQA
jgi:hypothetical protein